MIEQIIPHPYTHLAARAVRCETSVLCRWFDLETGEELPPFFGYGEGVQEKVDEWYANKRDEINNQYSKPDGVAND